MRLAQSRPVTRSTYPLQDSTLSPQLVALCADISQPTQPLVYQVTPGFRREVLWITAIDHCQQFSYAIPDLWC